MIAEHVYIDPSALTRLYLHQDGSREMVLWRRKTQGRLPVTHHGRTEIVNGIARAVFQGELNAEDSIIAWDRLDNDFLEGHLEQVNILWRATLNRASALSRRYTPTLGVRSLDVLHVSAAIELKLRWFFSFDARQQQLAKAVGLKLVRIR